jgi:hypothetical protein
MDRMGLLVVYTDRNSLLCCSADPPLGNRSDFFSTPDVVAAAREAREMGYDVLLLRDTEFRNGDRLGNRYPVFGIQRSGLISAIFD